MGRQLDVLITQVGMTQRIIDLLDRAYSVGFQFNPYQIILQNGSLATGAVQKGEILPSAALCNAINISNPSTVAIQLFAYHPAFGPTGKRMLTRVAASIGNTVIYSVNYFLPKGAQVGFEPEATLTNQSVFVFLNLLPCDDTPIEYFAGRNT